MVEKTRPLPGVTDDTKPYWDAASRGQLVIQKCGCCGAYQFYPRPFCIKCLSEDIEWVITKGTGTLYTYTINHKPAEPAFTDKVPYAVAIVQLDEGPRMLANIIDSPLDTVRIGARVSVRFERISEALTLPQFAIDGPRTEE